MSISPAAQPFDALIIPPDVSIREALARLDQAGTGALIVIGGEDTLYGLLTDGDIRRAVLRGVSLDEPAGSIANRNPIRARATVSARDALHLMTWHDINHLPLVDEEGRIQDFVLRKDLVAEDENLEVRARKRLDSVVVAASVPLAAALQQLDQAGTGALAVCGDDRRFLGLLTDGDIRRAILRGVSLDEPCGEIASPSPVKASSPPSGRQALRLMTKHDVEHLPVVDCDGTLRDLILRRDLTREPQLDLSAVIMAGGYGTRLYPLTERVPKPMLPVGNRPLLERTIQQLRRSGIRKVHLTTHYLPEAIEQHFGDGRAFGVSLDYSNEEQPLGTAGGLKRFGGAQGPFVVINGDILTGVSFQDMLLFHRKYKAEMTVGVRKYQLNVPFGVVECDDVRVSELREKPTLTLFINAGVYLLEPTVCEVIPDDCRFDMTDLVRQLLDGGRTVVSFPIIEYWQDVGRHEDYRQAQEDAQNGRI